MKYGFFCESIRANQPRLTFPRAKLRRQIFMTRAEEFGEELGDILDEIFWAFRAKCAVQNSPLKFLPKLLPIYLSMSCHDPCG